ncbi:MAG: class I SAM-dependent methyltransferase [Planctomycetota bacterium]
MNVNTSDTEKVHDQFLAYTAEKMDDPEAVERFESLKERCEAQFDADEKASLRVLDIGCGMGVQARVWARSGHEVTAVDLDDGLLQAGRKRASTDGVEIDWVQASADRVPLSDGQFDICLAIELLEHVPGWEACLDELGRCLRPGGYLVVTTTNSICPSQREFRLPLYSWWPGFLKKRMVRLAQTTKPELANFTAWPAVNWFNYWSLRREFKKRGMEGLDRFDLMDLSRKSWPIRMLVRTARVFPPVRAALYLFLPGTLMYGRRAPDG